MTENDSLPPTSDELELLAQLRANPHLAVGVGELIQRLGAEEGRGANAHEIEMVLREELQKLGQLSLKQWAQAACDRSVSEAQSEDPSLGRHEKKGSGGIAPSG